MANLIENFMTMLEQWDSLPKAEKAEPKSGDLTYKIFEEQTFWRWWTSLPNLGVTIVSTKTFVSKVLARDNMEEVLSEFGLKIKSIDTKKA